MEEVRSAEDSNVVGFGGFFSCRSPQFFPKRIGKCCGCTSLPHFFDCFFEKADHCPCTRLREGDVRWVSGDPLIENDVDSHAVVGVISVANSIPITAILGRPARTYTTKYCASHCPPFDDDTRLSLSNADSASRRALCCDIGTMDLVSMHTSTLV